MTIPQDGASRTDKRRADRLAYYLLKAVNKANRERKMLADGDHILVAVSGGKDSMTLLDLLRRRLRTGREHYSLVAGRVLSDLSCGKCVSPEWLEGYCEQHHIPLLVEEIEVAAEVEGASSKCFRCAWNRRKALFQMADRAGCNKLAFGHHADDIVETTLMNLFYTATLRRMDPKVSFFGGRIIVIRPLAYVEERDIVPFVKACGFPIHGEPCAEGQSSRRALVKRVLRELEDDCHGVKRSVFRAVDNYVEHLRRARECGLPDDLAS